MAKKDKKAKKKLPLAYKPLGFALSWTSGTLAKMAFQKTWKLIRHEDDAPDALDRDRRWGDPAGRGDPGRHLRGGAQCGGPGRCQGRRTLHRQLAGPGAGRPRLTRRTADPPSP
ncbi:hypothetical protein SHKM778_53360 [Streptomyces sp. KM77-8]|uniref:Uncharacterized protein n=1 Tax=Streptomyces haneummycinicus TaxID=3074435 RepID=A0AAT9HP41_9ACTN